MDTRQRVGWIGAGVVVATACAIAVLVTTGEPTDDDEAPASPVAVTPPKVPQPVEQGPAPIAKPRTSAEPATVQTPAKDVADAKKQAQQHAGILGSTAIRQGGGFPSPTGSGSGSGNVLGNANDKQYGGFGFVRPKSRPGGDSAHQGLGTIGSYGTIGHGSGLGRGYGVGGRRSSGPSVRLTRPMVTALVATGTLDPVIVHRFLRRHLQKLQYCYEKELLANAKLAGTVSATFDILETGAVANAGATGVDPTVSSCMQGVIAGIEFPRPKGDGGVRVRFSLALALATP